MSSKLPVLYSFRRCPYAIRARLAIYYSDITVELREIVLKNKPASMLAASPKGTVPVLLLPNSVEDKIPEDGDYTVIDESLDIMHWALEKNDPKGLLEIDQNIAQTLINQNDGEFKYYLDRYKYADRYPEDTEESYRLQAEGFIQKLDSLLASTPYLLGDDMSIADIAIAPFVRQFAHVDLKWFEQSAYEHVIHWLNHFKTSVEFEQVMLKYSPWSEGDHPLLFSAH